MNRIIIITCAALLFTGCATQSKLEDYTNNPSGLWEEGKALSKKGEALIIKGEKTIENARINANKGEALILSGNDAIQRSRQDYQLEATKAGRSSSPKEIEYEAERLASIGENWEDAQDSVKEGNKLIAQSEKKKVEGQQQISNGRKLVEQGTNFIRNSQRMRLEQPLTSETK